MDAAQIYVLGIALLLPRQALAGWGGENWGSMIWGSAVAVPALNWFGLALLSLSISAMAISVLRKRQYRLSLPVLLMLTAVPLMVAAGTVAVPNTFTNGTIADADEVNANFDLIEGAINDQDARLTSVEESPPGQGPPGTDGADGAPGTNGAPGADGVPGTSVIGANINSDGFLELTLDNGTILNAGAITEAAIGAAKPDLAIAGGPFDITFHDPVTGTEISPGSGDNVSAGETLEVRIKVTNVGLSPETAGMQVELLQSTVVLSPPSIGPPESLGILTLPALAPGSSHVLSFPAAFLAGFHVVTGQVEFDSNDAEHTNNTANVSIWIGIEASI